MRLRNLAYAVAVGCALGAGSALAEREAPTRNSVTSVSSFVQSWQQRILNENLPVADAPNWALRNMAKFASFSADRLDLARRATSVQELEALLVSAPISSGTGLGMLMATKPGNISLEGMSSSPSRGSMQKLDPGGSPTSYDDLVFTAVNACRIFDSRLSQGGAGPMLNGVGRSIKIGPFPSAGGGYAAGPGAQGGSATGCGLDALANIGDIAAVMVATSSFSQTGPGYLTFFSDSAADPSATVVSMFYTAGPVQTAFVVMATDLIPSVNSRGISRGANTELTIDIVGYFAAPKAAALECATITIAGTAAASSDTFIAFPVCAASFLRTGGYCFGPAANTNGFLIESGNSGCVYRNIAAGTFSINAVSQCCRTAGR